MKYLSLGFTPLLALMAATSQAAVTWDGGGGDGLWATPANWDTNNVPIGTDDVVVGLSAAVTGAANVFSKLDIQAGASVTMATDFLAAGNTIKADGTLNRAGVLRLIGSKVELTATGKLGAGVTFLDTSGGTMNFTNGASFGNVNMDFEHKGTNTFGYTLSPTGFQKLNVGRLRSGNSAVWADATYNIDISQYNTANGSTVVLADHTSHDAAYNGTFNPTVNIIAGSSGLAATLSFDTATSRLLLTFSNTITTLSPADNATGVAITSNLVATFSEAIAIGTGDITIKNLSDNTQTTIPITSGSPQITISGSTLTINPTADLAAGKLYAVQIATTAIKDLSNNPFGGISDDTTWNFTTANTNTNLITWDGGGGDGLWATPANWDTNNVPIGTDDVVVGLSAAVTGAANVFSKLDIQAGASVTMATDFLAAGNTIKVDGTLNRTGVLRLIGSKVELTATGKLGAGVTFLDTSGGTMNFANGASFGNTAMDFEHKGINTFGYTLSPTGFQKLNVGQLRSGNSAVWANVTYNIDISQYNTANGSTVVLADYSSHDAAYSGTFNPTVNIIAGASDLQGTLGFNTSLSQLVLTVTAVVHDTPTALNQSVSTPVNTAANFVLTGTDPEGDSLTFAVVTGPSHGTLTGTVPNLTYTPNNNFIGIDTLTFTASDGTFLSNPGTVTFAATPQTATQLWASLDTAIRTNALNSEWLTTWVDGGITLHQIRFDLGTLTGTQRTASPKIAAIYAYPTGGTNLPGIVDIHGGGQRAEEREAKYWAQQGYACISINWGGLPLINGLANTNWDGLPAGFTRAGVTQALHREEPEGQIYSDGSTLFADAHPLNISYLLCSYAARRALTFLSAQGNVASSKLGVTGHSMGGQITVLTATDPRVTCVTPSVGGSGYHFQDWWGLPGTARSMNTVHLDWYERTADPLSYWPSITCPTLFLQASNDFNAPFDLMTKGMAQQSPMVPQRLAVAPHFNHRFDDAAYASRVLWQKAHLTGSFNFPNTSVAQLDLNQTNGIPLFSVWPDTSTGHSIVSVDIYYGYERDPLTRFWRDAEAVQTSPGLWQARCPVHDTDEPLVAYAIVTYDCGFNLAMPPGYTNPTRRFSVVSEVKTIYPPDLANHGVRATETELRLIDDFSRGFHDWFILNPGHPTAFEFWTWKPNDPTWNGASGSSLSLGVTTTAANSLGITLQTVQWNPSPSTEYHATVALNAAGLNAVSLQVSDFTNSLNETLTTWDDVKLLRLSAGRIVDPSKPSWAGAIPVFSNLRWTGGSYPEDLTTAKGTPYLWLYENDLVADGDYAAADLNDSDSDGGKNWEEYQAGTDPNNPASAFKIKSFSSVGNQHTIEWQAVAGKTYSVWFSDDLMESNWILKQTGIPGVEPTTSATVPASGDRGFFRVGIAP